MTKNISRYLRQCSLILGTLWTACASMQAQDLFKPKFGLRAGASFTSMFGDREANVEEEYKITVRLSAGGTVRFALHERFGLAGEVLFVQKGAFYGATSTNSFLKLPAYANEQEAIYGYNKVNGNYVKREDINLKKRKSVNVINAYIEVPVMMYYELIDDRLQLDLGVAVGFLVDSRGLGTIKFGEESELNSTVPDPSRFIEMNLDYRMIQDEIGKLPSTLSRTAKIDGTTRTYPSSLGSYYLTDENEKNRQNIFNTVDFSLQVGLSYYFTPGLRLGARFGYSLLDITNSKYDYSQNSLDDNGNYIQRDDFDGNIGVQFFVGLQF